MFITILISVLITQLGSHNYTERELATQKLSQLSKIAVYQLHEAQHNSNPEISLRAARILHKHYKENASEFFKNRRMPWLDMLPYEEYIHHHLHEARSKIGTHNAPHWYDYRLATKLYMEAALVNGYSLQHIENTLSEMQKREDSWILRNGQRYNPPINMMSWK